MNNNVDGTANRNMPDWFIRMFPWISALLGGGALWYTWFRYHDLASRSELFWHEWIRLAFMLLFGALCLAATVLFFLGKSSRWSVFMGGLYMVPLLLVSNLVILIVRVILNIVQGKAQPLFEKLFAQPKNIAIPIIVIALVLLSILGKADQNKTSN